MKRLIAAILIVALLIPVFSSPASAEYDGEILFRDIPWGSNFNETLKALKNSGVKVDSYEVGENWELYMYNISGTVAGLYDTEFKLWFLDPTGKECDAKKPQNTVFYKGEYHYETKSDKYKRSQKTFRSNYVNTVLTETIVKLISLYGDYDDFKKETLELSYGKRTEWTYNWYGVNDTSLEFRFYYEFGHQYGGEEIDIYFTYESNQIYNEYKPKRDIEYDAYITKKNEESQAEQKRQEEEYINRVLSTVDGL